MHTFRVKTHLGFSCGQAASENARFRPQRFGLLSQELFTKIHKLGEKQSFLPQLKPHSYQVLK